jgi:hypothetical protein
MNTPFSDQPNPFNCSNIPMKNTPVRIPSGSARAIFRSAAAVCLLALAAGSFSLRAASSPPERMTYQGFLVDNNGAALAPGPNPINYPVVFRIYDASEGGAPLWSEQQIVTVDKGNFSVVLGEGTDVTGEPRGSLSSVFLGATASERYMGITVTSGGNNLTLLPRLRMLPSPYAFLASQAVQLVNPSTGSPFMSLTAGEATVPGNARFESSLFWGSGAGLTRDNGGSMELGNSLASSAFPYIDFHYGKSLSQDWNMRLINDADGRLSLLGGRLSFGNTVANTKIALWENGGAAYGLGVQGSQFRLHLDTPGARFSFLDAPAGAEVMTVQGNGNVGVGVSNPDHKFQVAGSDNVAAFSSSGANAYIRVWDNSGFNNRVEFASRGNGRAAIWTGTDVLNVLRNGKVGINTPNPAYLLNMVSPDYANARVRIDVGGTGSMAEFGRVENYLFLQMNNSYWSAGTRTVTYDGDSNWDFSSDRRLKKDIVDVEPMLDRALKIQVRRYRWKEDAPEAKHKLGVIAQEVQPLFPEMVSEIQSPDKPEEKTLSVGYGDFGVIAIKSIQELHKIVESKETRIASLEAEIATLKKQLAANTESSVQWEARFAALEKMVAATAALNSEVKGTELASRPAR